MICTTCATLYIMYYLRLLPSFSHLIRFRGDSPTFQRKIRVRRPRCARKNRSCCPWNMPSSPETSLSRYRPLIDNPFRSDPSRGQVEFCLITLSDQIQVEAKSNFVFGAAGHIIRIFQDMNVTSPEYLSG